MTNYEWYSSLCLKPNLISSFLSLNRILSPQKITLYSVIDYRFLITFNKKWFLEIIFFSCEIISGFLVCLYGFWEVSSPGFFRHFISVMFMYELRVDSDRVLYINWIAYFDVIDILQIYGQCAKKVSHEIRSKYKIYPVTFHKNNYLVC